MDRKEFSELLGKKVLVADGAMGTMLMGKCQCCNTEILNITNPLLVKSVHDDYIKAGAGVIFTNTFGANRIAFQKKAIKYDVSEANKAGARIARESAVESGKEIMVAGDMGPIDDYISPLGKVSFDDAYETYLEQARALSECDIIAIETMSDVKMLKAAVIAVRDACSLPIIVSMSFQQGRTAAGTDVKTFACIAESLDIDAIGANCSEGLEGLYGAAKELARFCSKPIMIKPNAGMPFIEKEKAVYPETPAEFAEYAVKLRKIGVNMIGGCCGTTPLHIKAIAEKLKNAKPAKRNMEIKSALCSRYNTIDLGKSTIIAGERINPAGRKAFRQEIIGGKGFYAIEQARMQAGEGALLLDVNAGVAGADEKKALKKIVSEVQQAVDIPLIIDTSSAEAMESALKEYAGKPLINSVSGSEKSLNAVLPLAKKYGAAIIALCLDEKGIPETKEKRIETAEKIAKEAGKYGIKKENIFVDCLVMAKATNPENEDIVLSAIREIKAEGYGTVLGISNISHGMPDRALLNNEFFSKASRQGLDIAIMNPADAIINEKKDSAKLKHLSGAVKADYDSMGLKDRIFNSIINGDKEKAGLFARQALSEISAAEINLVLVDAITEVGKRFHEKKMFLPQIISCANAMKTAFSELKPEFAKSGKPEKSRGNVLIATVENDIHDIGKNIVISMLESRGYDVIDIGANVPAEKIIEAVKKQGAKLLCLSALMTTTALEIDKVIKLLKKENISVPVLAGGAVITSEYAKSIGAHYAGDAISAVAEVQHLLGEK
ncbi:MAG: homocysteine S-methyltransferase family protein [Candidatus Nanoarchaeia archaeon]|nr:homocysteine S-methyltransferase family protein [Candidatus Nanoarchaeia archaeon]